LHFRISGISRFLGRTSGIKDLKYSNGFRPDFKEFRSSVRDFRDLESGFMDFGPDFRDFRSTI